MIMAHNEWGLLQQLITLLDDERNDIFILIDKKVRAKPNIIAEKSVVRFVPDSLRVDIRWGTSSLVEADLTLLEYAYSFSPYEYYHLLSGVDLPIKGNNYIHNFFSENKGKEFVGFMPYSKTNTYEQRLRYYHFFVPKTRKRSLRKYVPLVFHDILLFCQKALHIKRYPDIEIRKGEMWVSITEQFAKYTLERKLDIFRKIQYTQLVDELIWQTVIWNSPFRNSIYTLTSEHDGCMREIDWKRGRPYVWGQDEHDFEILMKSNKLFARKFSSKFPDIIDKVFNAINKENGKAK